MAYGKRRTPHSFENNRIQASPGKGYVSDADGNVEQINDGASALLRTFVWDKTNRLRETTNIGTSEVSTYAYDPFGRRIEKTVGAVTTHFLWDGDQLLAEYDSSGNRQVRYGYAGGFAPVQVAYGSPTETIYDVHTDHLDTPRMLTDATQVPVWRAAYEAYGLVPETALLEDPDGDTNKVTFNIRFPGQYYDEESESWDPTLNEGAGGFVKGTGLHYNRFRYYDPGVGRYVNANPIWITGWRANPNPRDP